jgi:hypothetical protein
VRDASASGSDLDHLDNGGLYRQARAFLEPVDSGDLVLAGGQRLPSLYKAGFRRRAPHVERENFGKTRLPAVVGSGKSARRRAGL